MFTTDHARLSTALLQAGLQRLAFIFLLTLFSSLPTIAAEGAPADALSAPGGEAALPSTESAAMAAPKTDVVPAAVVATPKPEPKPEPKRSLDARVQDLKKQAKALNRDLFILEEELLFPSNTQLAVFLSIDVGGYFRLDSVQLKIDNKLVTSHLYTARELSALQRGGVQRLWLGNVKSGEHELIATFTGPGPNNRDYRRATSVTFKKGSAAKFMELKIHDVTSKLQPEFVVREWD